MAKLENNNQFNRSEKNPCFLKIREKSSFTSRGFSLIEVVIAVSILIMGVVGSVVVLAKGVATSSESSSKLSAIYLAQEGIEIVRNIRDSNWLEARNDINNSWDEGLEEPLPGEAYIVDYATSQEVDPGLDLYSDQFLKIDSDGVYSYDVGSVETKFKRKIEILDKENLVGPNDKMTVVSTVTWEDKGKTKSFSIRENLYNWR